VTRRRKGEVVSRSIAFNCSAFTTAFPPGWFAATTKVDVVWARSRSMRPCYCPNSWGV